LERALRHGADFAFRSDDPDLFDKLAKATGGRMIDVAFDAVGIGATLRQAVASLDNYGKVVVVGMSAQDMNLGNFTEFNLKSKQVLGHIGYKSQDIAMLAEMLKYKRLDLSESVSDVISLKDITKEIERLEKHEGNPIRILVDPWA
jgi:threonine dehydrogenase-like Zn-dependent dehydrogenase